MNDSILNEPGTKFATQSRIVWASTLRAVVRMSYIVLPIAILVYIGNIAFRRQDAIGNTVGISLAWFLLAAVDGYSRGKAEVRKRQQAVIAALGHWDVSTLAEHRRSFLQDAETRFGVLPEAARQRLHGWDQDRLTEARKRLGGARQPADVGLED